LDEADLGSTDADLFYGKVVEHSTPDAETKVEEKVGDCQDIE
jgi:hypothetical protein